MLTVHTKQTGHNSAHLLLKKHGVDSLAARQNHHGKSNGHRHHKTHTDHFCHQVGWKVHEHVACNVLCEADVTKEAHLVNRELGDTVEDEQDFSSQKYSLGSF